MRKDYWTESFDVHGNGFSDQMLEDMASQSIVVSIDRKIDPIRKLPILFWTSENYSFGKCFRQELRWPVYLPLPFYSDHGVALESKLDPHEVNNKSKYHLTWYGGRYGNIKSGKKNVLRVVHPWISYRRRNGYEINNDSKGTLVFYAHSTEHVRLGYVDHDEYFSKLKALPSKYQPITVCLHQHDIKKGIHKELRKYDIPFVTMGYTSSENFVDRFYSIISKFRYASSMSPGSELFYCYEMGLEYFIYGNEPIYINHSDPNLPKGEMLKTDDEIYIESERKKRNCLLSIRPIVRVS